MSPSVFSIYELTQIPINSGTSVTGWAHSHIWLCSRWDPLNDRLFFSSVAPKEAWHDYLSILVFLPGLFNFMPLVCSISKFKVKSEVSDLEEFHIQTWIQQITAKNSKRLQKKKKKKSRLSGRLNTSCIIQALSRTLV